MLCCGVLATMKLFFLSFCALFCAVAYADNCTYVIGQDCLSASHVTAVDGPEPTLHELDIFVENMSGRELRYSSSSLVSGAWVQDPPQSIPDFSTGSCRLQTNIKGGPHGTMRYLVADGPPDVLEFDFVHPDSGESTYKCFPASTNSTISCCYPPVCKGTKQGVTYGVFPLK